MKKLLAIFELDAADVLSCQLVDLESGFWLSRVEDDGDTAAPFYLKVRDFAAENGWEVVEWDRRALMH